MLVPMERGVETHSVIVAIAVVAVVLILAYVTNPSAASFRTFLTELAFRRHLSKLHDASEADPPALTWARHSLHIDAPPHLQFATRASVSVRSSAHIFRSFGVLTIAAVTPVADHRNKHIPNGDAQASFASDHGRWFLGAFGKWWLGGALLLGKGDDTHGTAGLLDIRLLDDSELSKWTLIPDCNGRRTPPPLPKHASLPLHTQPSQKTLKPKSKSKSKSKPSGNQESAQLPASNPPTTTNIDAHPLLADLLQHIATTQTALNNTRAQLAQLHASTAHTREQTEEHAAQRAKHNSASATSDAAKTQAHQLTNARRTLRASQKTLAGVQATHAALEQRAKTLTEQAKSLHEKVIRDRERVKEGEEKGEARREEIADLIALRKEELRKVEEEIMGSQEDKEIVGLIGKVRALEAEVKEARKTLDELKAWQASAHEPKEEQEEQEQEHEREKEPGVVYIGQTPVRSSLSNVNQSNVQRIHGITPSHTRITSAPGTIGHSASISNQIITIPTTVASPPALDAASPARSARSKGYSIFDNDLASLGGPKVNTKKTIPAPIVGKAPTKGTPNSGLGLSAPVAKDIGLNQPASRPAFSPFDSDTLPITIPRHDSGGYALGPDHPVANTKYGVSSDVLTFGLAMDSPTAGAFSPPPSALLPSSLLSEDGHRWEGDPPSPGLFNDRSSPVQLINQNGTSPGQYRNGASPPRWEKDADGWVTEAKPAAGWDNKPMWDTKQANGNTWDNTFATGELGEANSGWMGEGRRRWPSESNGWAPREGRPRSLSNGSPAGRTRSDSHDAHRLSSGADSGYHSAVAPKKRGSGSSSGEDIVQDTSSTFAPSFLQSSPVSNSIEAPASFGPGIFASPPIRRGYDAQRASLPTRVPLIREVEESDPAPVLAETNVVPTKSRRWFPSVGSAKKDTDTNARVHKSELNPDAKAFSFSPDTSRIFNFTLGKTFNLGPTPASNAPAGSTARAGASTPTFAPFALGVHANASTPTLGSTGSSTFFSSLLAFAPSPAEREALQRALGPNNGLTRTLSGTSARSPFTSPLPSARSSAVDLSLSDKAAFAWNDPTAAPVQKRTWFPVRKKAVVEESE
ncbi:Chromatin modification-related protein eaf-1 [Rhizoctonia solani]|uniref:Chromatin modification-related protein eaf-1 n=1 Tax=Rhizoctonia solani TaxID=456999 RepID=A0A0K6FKT6_9AGAM|nr:Chromatin modification-related protein eaf-1 [Rhizoctonia solani]